MAIVLDELECPAGQTIPAGVGQFCRRIQQQSTDNQFRRGDQRVQRQKHI